ncbi:MAG: hypothetical protein NVSMB31_18830 [Vulcanimicrobiaceae bacterium]
MLSTLLLAAIVGSSPVALAPYNPTPVRVAYADTQQQMLADLNATRHQAGLRPLTLERHLTTAANKHAGDMASHGYFDHASRNGRSPFDRMHADGCHFAYAGENIAMSDSEREAYSALLQSPEHRENILNPHYTRVGIGIAASADGSLMFVQDFSD